MRFYTPEFYESIYRGDDDGFESHISTYEQAVTYLETLGLPPEIKAIANPFYVDDALVAVVQQSDDPPVLRLVLRRGNLQIEYFDLDLTYESPDIDDSSLRALLEVADNAKSARRYGMTDAYCHEFDRDSDGRLVHTILFHSPGERPNEVTVRCHGIKVHETPRPGRTLPPFTRRYRIARFNASSASNGQ